MAIQWSTVGSSWNCKAMRSLWMLVGMCLGGVRCEAPINAEFRCLDDRRYCMLAPEVQNRREADSMIVGKSSKILLCHKPLGFSCFYSPSLPRSHSLDLSKKSYIDRVYQSFASKTRWVRSSGLKILEMEHGIMWHKRSFCHLKISQWFSSRDLQFQRNWPRILISSHWYPGHKFEHFSQRYLSQFLTCLCLFHFVRVSHAFICLRRVYMASKVVLPKVRTTSFLAITTWRNRVFQCSDPTQVEYASMIE